MDLASFIQSEVREKQVSRIIEYTGNLEQWYRWTYLLGKNTDADTADGHADTGQGESRAGTNWNSSMAIHSTTCETDG